MSQGASESIVRFDKNSGELTTEMERPKDPPIFKASMVVLFSMGVLTLANLFNIRYVETIAGAPKDLTKNSAQKT